MRLAKVYKDIKLDKRIGNVRLTTTRYAEPRDDGWHHYKTVDLWYDNDCENCPCGWDKMSYEGECEDCGCLFDYDFNVPVWKCMLPKRIKRLYRRLKYEKY